MMSNFGTSTFLSSDSSTFLFNWAFTAEQKHSTSYLVFWWWLQTHNKKKVNGPFLLMGFNCLRARATLRRQFTFHHLVQRNFWYWFYQPRKDERLSQPWSHPVVLNTESLDWEYNMCTRWWYSHALSRTKLEEFWEAYLVIRVSFFVCYMEFF